MSIVPAPPGGTAFVYTVLADVINAAWDNGLTKQTQFEAKIANAQSGFLDVTSAPHVTAGTVPIPSVTEPTVTIPSSVSTTDVMTLFDTKYLELVALLSSKFTDFRAAYFPDEGAVYSAAESFLQAALSDPEVGLPSAVKDQILTDARDSALDEAARATDETMTLFAAKRFPLPSGVVSNAILQIEARSQDAMSEAAIKLSTQSIEQVRFLIDKTLGLRQTAMSAAIDYIKALASGPDMASKLVGYGYDAQSKLISSASQFYNSRTAAAEMVSKTYQYNNSLALEAATKNQSSDLTLIEDKLKALLTECQLVAQMATALFNNLHASAAATGTDTVTTNLS